MNNLGRYDRKSWLTRRFTDDQRTLRQALDCLERESYFGARPLTRRETFLLRQRKVLRYDINEFINTRRVLFGEFNYHSGTPQEKQLAYVKVCEHTRQFSLAIGINRTEPYSFHDQLPSMY